MDWSSHWQCLVIVAGSVRLATLAFHLNACGLKDNSSAAEDINVRVLPGFLEASNVNAVDELTNILSLSRQYEMSVKLMQTIDQSSEASAKLLQIN